MYISELLVKDFWYRRVNADAVTIPNPTNPNGYRHVNFTDGIRRRALTNDDFINELELTAHEINSRYWSTRPIREIRERDVVLEDGAKKKVKEWAVTGYDDMETVRLGFQKRFSMAKASFFAANGFNISNETTDSKSYDTLMSWKDIAGLDVGFFELVQSCFQSGDAAIYLYQTGNTIEYKVFSSLYGDKLYFHYDENFNPVGVREYTLRGQRAVDIYRVSSVETWVQINPEDEKTKSWVNKVGGWFARGIDWHTSAVSEDGWRRIANRENQIGDKLNPFIYFRINDVVWGSAQEDISGLERAMSYVAEESKNIAFPDMFVKATKIDNMPAIGAHGRTWAARGTADEIKAADVKAIEKPNMSDIATVDLKNRLDSILRTTMSVFIDPEIVKSSDISGVGIKVLYGPEIQFAQNMWPQFYSQLKYMVEVFKALVAKIEKNGAIATLRTSIWQEIYLPEDEAAKVKLELDQLYARAKSRKAVMADLNNQHLGDAEQIIKEWIEELDIKARIPAIASAEVQAEYGEGDQSAQVNDEIDPNRPNITNQAAGISVLE